MITDYVGSITNLNQTESPTIQILGLAMLMNLIYGPMFPGYLITLNKLLSLLIIVTPQILTP